MNIKSWYEEQCSMLIVCFIPIHLRKVRKILFIMLIVLRGFLLLTATCFPLPGYLLVSVTFFSNTFTKTESVSANQRRNTYSWLHYCIWEDNFKTSSTIHSWHYVCYSPLTLCTLNICWENNLVDLFSPNIKHKTQNTTVD